MRLSHEEIFDKVVFAFKDRPSETITTNELTIACYPNPTLKQRAQVCGVLANMRIMQYVKRVRRGVYQLTKDGKEYLKW